MIQNHAKQSFYQRVKLVQVQATAIPSNLMPVKTTSASDNSTFITKKKLIERFAKDLSFKYSLN